MRGLFPEISPYHTGFLPVSDLHTLYYEECGNPQGQPVVFLHGGPGAGLNPRQRQFFDPAFYRIILLDQRGAGQSTPGGELRQNTTWDLVSDLEKLRAALGVEHWLVFGGSWGSTLALAYAAFHPEPVVGLILRGVFLCRSSEIHWFYQDGASHIYPEAWEKFLEPIPPAERQELVQAYYRRLTSASQDERLAAALAWNTWESSTAHLLPPPEDEEPTNPQHELAFARIECHYMVNRAFMPSDSYLLEQIGALRRTPTRIVQGRYDVCCPAVTAWEVRQALPQADLRIVPDAGHSSLEPGITSELVQAADDFKALFN
jgi:proline iminopeptidase